MHLICVAQSNSSRQRFTNIAKDCSEVSSLHVFADVAQALEWAKQHIIDMAFVQCHTPQDLENAKRLMDCSDQLRVVLLADDGRYALEAWQMQACGYLLNPCTAEDINREMAKCVFRPVASQRVVIRTIPSFAVTVNGRPLHISAAKPRELFALLVDCAERGLTTSEGIALLWPDKADDERTRSLFRMTYKRLLAILEEAGVGDIIGSNNNKRYLHMDKVNCDLYHLLAGNEQAQRRYAGQYMQEYSWAEERNAQLYRMLLLKD